jgi:hypothetical protein
MVQPVGGRISIGVGPERVGYHVPVETVARRQRQQLDERGRPPQPPFARPDPPRSERHLKAAEQTNLQATEFALH